MYVLNQYVLRRKCFRVAETSIKFAAAFTSADYVGDGESEKCGAKRG